MGAGGPGIQGRRPAVTAMLRRISVALAIPVFLPLVGALLLPLTAEAQSFGRIVGGAIGGRVLGSGTALGSDRRFVIQRPRLRIAEGQRAGAVIRMAFGRDRDFLFTVLSDGSARWWDLRRGLQRGTMPGGSILSGTVRGGGAAMEMVAVRADGSSVLQRLDGTSYPLSGPVSGFDGTIQPAIAGNGAIAFRTRDGTWWVGVRDGERVVLPEAAAEALPTFSADGYRLAWLTDHGRAVRVMRPAHRTPEPSGLISGCSGSARITAARFTPAGSRLLLGDADGRICLWDLSGGDRPQLLFSVRTALQGPVRTMAMDHQRRLAAVGDGRQRVELWPIAGRIARVSSVTLGLSAASALALDAERGWLLAGGENGKLVVHDFRDRNDGQRSRPVAQLLSTDAGWSVLDRNGRFDGSQNGIDALSWTGATEGDEAGHILPLDAFSESHYEPGLLAKLDAPASALLNDAARDLPGSGYIRPPRVTIDTGARDGAGRLSLTVRVERGYPARHIAGLRLYRNGKLVLDAAGEAALETGMALVPGENRVRAVAVGPDGVEGPPATLTVMGPGAPSASKLNVVAIGINDYANPAWELFYPRNDAETMVATLREKGVRMRGSRDGAPFGGVHAETLLDRLARKDAIEDLLSQSSMDVNDVLVVYFAGHGYALREERGWDWYLLPYTREWRRRTDSPEEFDDMIRRHGLSARRLMTLLTQAAAQRVFLVLDSCYSGAVVEAVEGIAASRPKAGDDAATQKVLRQIARIGGLHVLAASRAHERATELQLEPHGALTWLVLDGLKGGADTNGDRTVSVRELIEYASAEMPKLADRLSQEPISQKPMGYSRGIDFAVAGLN